MSGQSRPEFHQVDRIRMSLTGAKMGHLGKTSLLTLQSKREGISLLLKCPRVD